MADAKRNVEFKLTVDPSPLENGINRAVKAFDKLDTASTKAMTASKFDISNSALNGYQRQVSKISGEMKKLTSSINSMSGSLRNSIQIDMTPINTAVKGLKAVTDYLSNTSTVSTDSMKKINQVFSIVNQSIQGFTSELKATSSVAQESGIQKITPALTTLNVESAKSTRNLKVLTDSVRNATEPFRSLREVIPQSVGTLGDTLSIAESKLMQFKAETASVKSSVEDLGVKGKAALQGIYLGMDLVPIKNKVKSELEEINRAFGSSKTTLDGIKASVYHMPNAFSKARLEAEGLSNAIKTAFEQMRADKILNGDSETSNQRYKRTFEDYQNAIKQLQEKMQDFGNISVGELERINNKVEQAFSAFQDSTLEVERAQEAMKKWQETMESAKGDGEEVVSAAFGGKIEIAVAALKKFVSVTKEVKSVVDKAKSKMQEFVDKFTKLNPLVKESNSLIKQLIPTISLLAVAGSVWKSMENSIEYIENLNLFTVAMGDAVDEGLKFVDTMAEVYGMDPSNLYRYAGNFYQLTDAIDMTSAASKNISLSLTKAMNDISSLFNVDIETVFENLSSGMQGMSRAVRKYGIDIRQATLAQTGLNYGFTENVSTTSEANRQALRFLTMMQQVKNATQQQTKALEEYTEVDFYEIAQRFDVTFQEVEEAFAEAMSGNEDAVRRFGIVAGDAMGDFARNIETPANQLRIIQEQLSRLATAIGNLFIPLLDAVLYKINGLIQAVRILITFITSLLGIQTDTFGGEFSGAADDVAGAVGGIGDAAEETKDKLGDLIAPFDELNILAEDTADASKDVGGGGFDMGALDPALEEAIANMTLELDEIRMKALDVRDAILEWLGLLYNPETGNITTIEGGFMDQIIAAINNDDWYHVGDLIAQKLNEGIEWAIEQTDPQVLGRKIYEKCLLAAQFANGLVENLNFEGIGTVLGNLFTDALMGIDAFIRAFNWDSLAEQLTNGIKGFIRAVDWELVGTTISDGFNAASEFMYTFWTEFPWGEVGKDLGTAVQTFFENTDWETMGKVNGAKTNGIVKLVQGFFSTYKQGTISKSLADMFNAEVKEVDWGAVAGTASRGIRAFFAEIFNFSKHVDKAELAHSIFDFCANLNWVGIFLDVVNFIINAVRGLVIGIGVALAGLVVSGVKGVIEAFADFVLGILGALWNGVSWFKENILHMEVDPNPFTEMANEIHDAFWGPLGDSGEEAEEWGTEVRTRSRGGIEADGGFSSVGWDAAESLYEGLKHESNRPQEFGNHVMKSVEDQLIGKDQMKDLGKNSALKLYEGLDDEESMGGIQSFCDRVVGKATEGFSGKFESIGSDLTRGLVKGMESEIARTGTGTLNNFTQTVLDKTRTNFRINSPSKEFEEIGKYLSDGLLQGMQYNTEMIKTAYSKMFSDLIPYVTNFQLKAMEELVKLQQYIINTFTWEVKNSMQNLTSEMAAMYGMMGSRSISVIQEIISALNAIPRNITTVHTIITNSVTNSVGGVTNAASSATSRGKDTSGKIKMAAGGVVTGPTDAWIGEGAYDEAVIPLGNSPQIEELIGRIADAVAQNNNGQNQPPIEVKVQIGDKEWDAFTYKSAQRGEKLVGAQPISTTRR